MLSGLEAFSLHFAIVWYVDQEFSVLLILLETRNVIKMLESSYTIVFIGRGQS